jgi:virulence factor
MTETFKKIRIGVIGVGTMGRHHVRIAAGIEGAFLAGIYDVDSDRASEISTLFECHKFSSMDVLLENVDAVIVATPTFLHSEIGETCLLAGVHVMMEKPLASSFSEAKILVNLARDRGLVLMVGHVERYNPVIVSLMEMLQRFSEKILAIDCRRLSPFDGTRCMDVDIIYDLLIHDVDLALEIAGSSVVSVSGWGRPVFSGKIDLAHTQIQFSNDCLASFWTGKCSPRKVRTISVMTQKHYLQADTLSKLLSVSSCDNSVCSGDSDIKIMENISHREIQASDQEPLYNEMMDFVSCVREDSCPIVNGNRALEALRILELVSTEVSKTRSRGN